MFLFAARVPAMRRSVPGEVAFASKKRQNSIGFFRYLDFEGALVSQMKTRALVIAIEKYPTSLETSRTLPGTLDNAKKFTQWLEQNLIVAATDIIFCTSAPPGEADYGTSRKQIKRALQRLIQDGIDDTERLFVFLTGHGVMKPSQNGEPHEDFLLCSEFESSAISGDECIRISELTTLLSRNLGAGSHFYFIDCCRTVSSVLNPGNLGIAGTPANSGVANIYLLHSAASGAAATNDSLFTDLVLRCLSGEGEMDQDPNSPGDYHITFRNVARTVEQGFNQVQRSVEIRTIAQKSDVRVRTVQRAGPTATIQNSSGRKSPPVELLTLYDEVIFLGETNSQLYPMIEKAFAARQQRRWKRLDVLSIEDLTQAARPELTLPQLELERGTAEEKLQGNAARFAEEFSLYRYNYVGTYGSLWKASDGRRRVHVSARLPGIDIRISPASDIVDFPANRHPQVDLYFRIAEAAIRSGEARCIFRHPGDPDPAEGRA